MTAPDITTPGLDDLLQEHPAWTVAHGKLRREFLFRDFVAAFGFMTKVALLAERAGHHPEWSNVYNRLTVELTTHDAGGITEKDVALARQLEALLSAGGT